MDQFSQFPETPMTHDRDSRYIPNHEYTTASRMAQMSTAPLPPIYDSDHVDTRGISATGHVFQEGDFVCPGFFDKVNMDYFNPNFKLSGWSYSMRRGAQPVLPFLYLGPSSFLKDLDFLSGNGFTLLLAVRSKQSARARLVSGESPAMYLGIEADTVDVTDGQELIAALPRAVRRINDHLASSEPGKSGTWPPKKIFVFCESGNERSAMVVMAYVMVMFNLDFAGAINMVQQRRFSISIEERLRHLMMNFESILVAKRDVEASRRAAEKSNSITSSMGASRKRDHTNLVDSDASANDEMDIDESQDLAADRTPVAPFQDR
ncbi:hypothetical protein PHISP_02754 [Aspergillus sp. HF37]|nr:hypothetical protein PHISP_02754 [Aspergillus sp. HF37]